MRNQKLLLFLLAVAFIPYVLVCFEALPFADDFCFGWTASQTIPFLQKFLNQYLLWNGRYTADVLVNLHPILTGKVLYYRLCLAVSLLATPMALYFLISRFADGKFVAWLLSLFISVFYLCYLPNITEGMYWYIGITNYHLGNACFVLQLALFVYALAHNNTKRMVAALLSYLLLVLSIGFNEVGAALIPIYYFTGAVAAFVQKKESKNYWIAAFVIAAIASLFVFLSPGNFVRQHEFANRFDLLHSLYYSILQTIRFSGKWCLNIPFVAISLAVIVLSEKINNSIAKFDWRIILCLLLLTIFMSVFLPYMATGILGQHRTINYVFFFAVILWLWLLVSVLYRYNLTTILHSRQKVVSFIIVASTMLTLFCGNGGILLKDIYQFNFVFYEREFFIRQERILANPTAPISAIPEVPESFKIVDAKSDSTYWVDKCMMRFYSETGIELK